MSSDSLPDFDEWLADVGWLPISYEAIGARRAWDYLSAAAEARADSAVPSSHVSGEYERGYEHGHADATRQAITGSTYTYAVGDAGQRYMARFEHAHPLPALFRWQELWDAMSSAAAVHHEAPEPNDPKQSIEGVAKP